MKKVPAIFQFIYAVLGYAIVKSIFEIAMKKTDTATFLRTLGILIPAFIITVLTHYLLKKYKKIP